MSRRESSAVKSDLLEEVICVNRVSKTVKGGRVLRFSATVVVGDGRGSVGVGSGKAKEVATAVASALAKAKGNMITINVNKSTVQYPAVLKYGATRIIFRPATDGTGIIAGASMRAVFAAAGVQNVIAKSLGSSNKGNVVKATMAALKELESPAHIAARRGKTVEELFQQ